MSDTAGSPLSADLVSSARRLSDAVDALVFAEPVTHVYNPLDYARELHEDYLSRAAPKETGAVVFLGMNPGPWGMAQTGVPFGEVPAVRDWMGVRGEIRRPEGEHPKRPVQGLDCPRSEVSGRRLWGLMMERFGSFASFAEAHFVVNYCPLVFMEAGGRNRTPDKLPAAEREPLEAACDGHLVEVLEILRPRWAIGVGAFAEKRLLGAVEHIGPGTSVPQVGRILHPSPASPAANRGWAAQAVAQLEALGVW